MKANKPQFFPQGFLAGYSEALHVTACSPREWNTQCQCGSLVSWKVAVKYFPPVYSTSQILNSD